MTGNGVWYKLSRLVVGVYVEVGVRRLWIRFFVATVYSLSRVVWRVSQCPSMHVISKFLAGSVLGCRGLYIRQKCLQHAVS